MANKVVLFYSDLADPVVQAAKRVREHLPDLYILGYDRLLKHLKPADWPQMIQSDFPRELRELFQDAVVINRLFCFDPTIAHNEMMLKAQHELWLHVAVSPLLESARKLTHDVSVRGVSMTLQPLNLQWFHLESEKSLKLPPFAYGFGAEEPSIDHLSDPMQKSIWSLFDWKTERHLPEKEAGWHKFYVQRPSGVPVICHYLGENFWCDFPRGETRVDGAELARMMAVVRKTFISDLGEFLFYREDDGELRFHAFSPYMTGIADSQVFSDKLVNWLKQIQQAPAPEHA